MSDIRLYMDEDAEQRAIVDGLRDRNIDVVTAMEADMLGTTDREQLEYAIEHERTMYSLNVGDFARLHKEHLDAGKNHFGTVLISKQRYDVGEKIRRLVDLVNTRTAQEVFNQIAFLSVAPLVDIDETMLTAVKGHLLNLIDANVLLDVTLARPDLH